MNAQSAQCVRAKQLLAGTKSKSKFKFGELAGTNYYGTKTVLVMCKNMCWRGLQIFVNVCKYLNPGERT
jgi:hypothetical protein